MPSSNRHHAFDNLLDVLRYRAERAEGRLIWCSSSGEVAETLTTAQLLRSAMGLATSTELAAGERVALVYPPGLGYVRAFYGALAAGLVPVPVYPPDRAASKRTAPRLEAILANSEARELWTDAPTAEVLEQLAPKGSRLATTPRSITDAIGPCDDDGRAGPAGSALAFLQYTSGSTRSPRGVRLNHEHLLRNSRMIEAALQNRPGTTGVTWLPPYHDMGLIGGLIQPVFAGLDIVMLSPTAFVRRPRLWLDLISRHRARATAGPNFAYALCARRIGEDELEGLDLSCLEVAVCGAEPIRADELRRFAAKFAPVGFRAQAFAPSYGLAEATLLVSACARSATLEPLRTFRAEIEPLSRGLAVPAAEGGQEIVACGEAALDTEISIRAGSGDVLPDRLVGEIVVRSPSVASGYHHNEAETRATFVNGELHTGDLGFLDAGQLYVVGRMKELLIIRGRKYHPHDFEAVITSDVPGVRAGRIIAGTFAGDEPVPAVLAELEQRGSDTASTLNAIQTVLRTQFGVACEAAILPKGSIHFTSSGKAERVNTFALVARGEIVPLAVSVGLEMLLSSQPAASGLLRPSEFRLRAPEPESATLVRMVRELAPLLRVRPEEIDVDRNLIDLGLDSLAAAELQSALVQTYDVEVDLSHLVRGATMRSLAREVDAARAAGQRILRGSSADGEAPGAPSVVGSNQVPRVRPSLFFYENTNTEAEIQRHALYADLERVVRIADEAGFEAVWLPERHFHAFGAPFPNPAVLAAALAVQTGQIALRAGGLVLPLHHAARVAEEWAMVDRLSGGRVGLSFTSGGSPRDFVLNSGGFDHRDNVLFERIDEVRALWRGDSRTLPDGRGAAATIQTQPRPLQRELPVWLTCADQRQHFEEAGRHGFNVLTGPMVRDFEALDERIAAYRAARAAAGFDRGRVTLAIHTFVGESDAHARATSRKPLKAYLEASGQFGSLRTAEQSDREKNNALEAATDECRARALIGSQHDCREKLHRFGELGVDEVACQIDFGVAAEEVEAGLARLSALWA